MVNKNRKLFNIFFISCLFLFTIVSASSLAKADLDKDTKTIMGIKIFLKETAISDVKKILGNAVNIISGDASTAENKICYRSNDPANPQSIEFIAGEMGGLRIITFVCMHPFDNKVENGPKYFLVNKKNEDISTMSGLKIGVTKEWVRKKFGNPNALLYSPDPGAKRDAIKEKPWKEKDFLNNEWVYYYHSEVKVLPGQNDYQRLKKWEREKEPYYDITATITLRFENGKAVFIKITRIETT